MLIVIACATRNLSAQDTAAATRATPNYANLDYAPADPVGTTGHKLDLYIPSDSSKPLPVVIWTGGSAWMATNGKDLAGILAAQLNPAGYAVAGVRSVPVFR